jgi:hypothetical protein
MEAAVLESNASLAAEMAYVHEIWSETVVGVVE